MIRRRHDHRVQSDGGRAREDLWQASVRAYHERRADDKRLERLHYHEGQARRLSETLGSLVAYHETEAAKYRNGQEEERYGHHD